jgi:nucleotide-binding universal stress UspA family protein
MRILIATDGSEFSGAAAQFLSKLAGEGSHDVKIITVVEPAAGTELETFIEESDELLATDSPAGEDGRRQLAEFRNSFEKLCQDGVVCSTELLAGPAARTICEKADEWKAELIVMGSHGRGFLGRAWFGSVSDKVIHHAPCSVMIVR